MTRPQHEATRELAAAELKWLLAYGWRRVLPGSRLAHKFAPDTRPDYSVRDAISMTRADPLRYSFT
jgi:hypothetical protein